MGDTFAGEPAVEVVAVRVGLPRVVGQVRGEPVESGIAKAPVAAPRLALTRTNLAGDRQADLTVHGGPDKAVYVYPSEHYPGWRRAGFALAPGGVGENMVLRGATEHDVRIGDVWRWGDAVVQVSQPRAPCFKLALHVGRRGAGRRMIETGHCGWYLRVLEPGAVPTRGPLALDERDDAAPSVHEAFAAMFPGAAPVDPRNATPVERVLAAPALAAAWREPLLARRPGARR
ncbi:MAG TPA: MOSC domain-containing protein [Acidimicrobiales bacterium]